VSEGGWLQMSDPYFQAIQEKWQYIRGLYLTFSSKKPVMLYDIHDKKIYAYPYKEFKQELNKKSQQLLEQDYKSASASGSMVVFVRDNVQQNLVSYVVRIGSTVSAPQAP
jgi:hypothetical protein